MLAYDMSGGARSTNRDVDISASDTDNGVGIWSNGETLWVVDDLAKRIYAYAVPVWAVHSERGRYGRASFVRWCPRSRAAT